MPHTIAHGAVGLVVMAVSIVAVGLLVMVQRITVSRTGSLAIGADLLHYLGDLLTNLGVIVGIVLSMQFGILLADPSSASSLHAFCHGVPGMCSAAATTS